MSETQMSEPQTGSRTEPGKKRSRQADWQHRNRAAGRCGQCGRRKEKGRLDKWLCRKCAGKKYRLGVKRAALVRGLANVAIQLEQVRARVPNLIPASQQAKIKSNRRKVKNDLR